MSDAAVGYLLDKLKQVLLKNDTFSINVKGEVQDLTSGLEMFKVFLKDSEDQNREYEFGKHLIAEIRDLTYEVEDAIDAFVVEAAGYKAKRRLEKAFRTVNHTERLREVASKVQTTAAKLKEVVSNPTYGSALQGREPGGRIMTERRPPKVEEDNVVGFEEPTRTLIDQLTAKTEDLQVISIVGMGGLGKTTLANKVFNDPRVSDAFSTRAWIYVSQTYTKKDLLLSILKSGNQIPKATDEKSLVKEVRVHLNWKYLIVLDDVWDEKDWDNIKEAFPDNKNGSRILLTSRNEPVAVHADPHSPPYKPNFLKESESLELLQIGVFGRREFPQESQDLMLVGMEIANKCHGLPLAVVVIAGMLQTKISKDWWDTVSASINKFLVNDEKGCIQVLALSYNHLPPHLKACFLYFGVFPEDYEIPVWILTRLWIAERFVRTTGDASLEEMAEDYLEDLAARNLVLVARRSFSGQIKTCRIHDLVRNLCLTKAQEESFLWEIKENDGSNSSTYSTRIVSVKHRRLCINSGILNYISSKPCGFPVRSFLCFAKDKVNLPREHVGYIPNEFKLLRVYHIQPIGSPRFPSEIEKLVHLTYIAFSGDFKTIPAAMSNLWNLQTLIAETSSRTTRTIDIKADILNMSQFRHLHTNKASQLHGPIARTSKDPEITSSNTSIQTLAAITPESCTEDILGQTPCLKKLGIRGKLVTLLEEGESPLFDNLTKLQQLVTLKLLNDVFPDPPSESRLQGLPPWSKFPPNLKRLTLADTFIDWEHMYVLGRLPELEELKLKDNAFTGGCWSLEDGGFKKLKALQIWKTDLEFWKAKEDHFPSLQHVFLRDCTKLVEIPSSLGNVKTLRTIKLHGGSYSSANSARKIKQWQQESKVYNGLKVEIFPLDLGQGSSPGAAVEDSKLQKPVPILGGADITGNGNILPDFPSEKGPNIGATLPISSVVEASNVEIKISRNAYPSEVCTKVYIQNEETLKSDKAQKGALSLPLLDAQLFEDTQANITKDPAKISASLDTIITIEGPVEPIGSQEAQDIITYPERVQLIQRQSEVRSLRCCVHVYWGFKKLLESLQIRKAEEDHFLEDASGPYSLISEFFSEDETNPAIEVVTDSSSGARKGAGNTGTKSISGYSVTDNSSVRDSASEKGFGDDGLVATLTKVGSQRDDNFDGFRFQPSEKSSEEHATNKFWIDIAESHDEIQLIKEIDNEVTEFDVERVLEKQDTHDLYCPNCYSCITRRVILRKREHKIRISDNPKRYKLETIVAAESDGISVHATNGADISLAGSMEPAADGYDHVKEPEIFRFQPSEKSSEEHATNKSLIGIADSHDEIKLIKEIDNLVTKFDVERVLEKQDTHDLYCPNCHSCITRRVILRIRKRKTRISSDYPKCYKLETVVADKSDGISVRANNAACISLAGSMECAADEYDHMRGPEVFRCLSCFSIFIPSGEGFKLFKIFGDKSGKEKMQSPQPIPAVKKNWLFSIFASRKEEMLSDQGSDHKTYMEENFVAKSEQEIASPLVYSFGAQGAERVSFENEVGVMDGTNPAKEVVTCSSSIAGNTVTLGGNNISNVEEKKVVVCFEKEVNTLMGKLEEGRPLEIISIVGVSGCGKTTLAREVYNHPWTSHIFTIRAWVDVSQDYDTTRKRNLLIRILKFTNSPENNEDTEDKLGEKIYNCLKGKKYLIVMNDIWGIEVWNDIQRSLPNEHKGSKVLFTSQLPVQPDGVPYIPHCLGPLPKHCSWKLLQQEVFKKECCPPDLEEIGNQIAEKCEGLPLVLVAIAEILAEFRTLYVWEDVGKHLWLTISKNQKNCMKRLELSYNHLPIHLKKCFLYIGAHPEDYEIPVRELICLWIAEGFIQESEGGKSLEAIAKDYLISLIDRNLVVVSRKSSIGTDKTCRVPNLLRELCLEKVEKDNILEQGCLFIARKFFHMFSPRHREQDNFPRHGAQNLQSFRHPSLPNSSSPMHDEENLSFFVKNFKLLRALYLVSATSLGEVEKGDLVHLRYLALRLQKGELRHATIPFHYLSNLETLNLQVPDSDKITLPRGIVKMVKLRHLHTKMGIFQCHDSYDEEEGNMLDSLQTLHRICVCEHCLRFLERTPYLRKLGLTRARDKPWDDVLLLPDLEFLKCLETLYVYGWVRWDSGSVRGLKFPSTLTRLTLSCTYLKWEELSIILQTLSSLEVLKLLKGACNGTVWNTSELEEGFSQLKYLRLEYLDIVEWIAFEDQFLGLQVLELEGCRNLKGIPIAFAGLYELREIKVELSSRSAEESAEEIQEKQRNTRDDDEFVNLVLRCNLE